MHITVSGITYISEKRFHRLNVDKTHTRKTSNAENLQLFFFYKIFVLIMQDTQIAGKLIQVCTQFNKGATSDLKELMECAVSASWGK